MKIKLHKIPIQKVVAGYKDSAEEGVTAYDGKLNIRPKYQREFVYKEKQRNAVIETIKNNFPLNVMYWMIREDLPAPRPGEFCVYVLKCADSSFYIGQTDDYERRLKEHSDGKGAEWTKNHLPFEPIHWEIFNNREKAVKREKELKTGFGRKWLKRECKKGALARQAGGGYELLDGQQRTISIGQYINGDFSLNDRFFHNLTKEEQDKILDYELMIYFCKGTDKERLDWFRIINIAGEKLTDQEIRNAVYTGPWLSDAKLKFSKSNCAAYLLSNDGGSLVSGSPIR